MQFELNRYSCQMALPGFTKEKQNLLTKSKVLIIGMGGLGCPVAQYLVAAGVGTVGIVDNDTISQSNLHRQILYTPEDVGLLKVEVAYKKLQQQNPQVHVIPYPVKITKNNVIKIIQDYDIIIDGTDNFETKYLLNDACVLIKKPMVFGAIYQYEGQVAILNTKNSNNTRTPNYRDLFPDAINASIPNCSQGGVMPTLAGIVGCMQANETIKYLIRSKDLLTGRLWMINLQTGQVNIIKIGNTSHAKIHSLPQTESIPLISQKKFKNGMENKLYDLIDVRSKEEHEVFNLGGVNIPLDKLIKDIGHYYFEKPVVFYCKSGKRSAEAVRVLHLKYPSNEFYSLDGGVNACVKNV